MIRDIWHIRDIWRISAVLFLLILKIVFWIIGLRVIFIRVIMHYGKALLRLLKKFYTMGHPVLCM